MAEIKKINVDGVDYDIVSESAERKIAELEKNNTALASVKIGEKIEGGPLSINLGSSVNIYDDIYIGTDVFLGGEALIGTGVVVGTKYPVSIGWEDNGSLTIRSNGGNRGSITIGSNVNLTVGNSSSGSIPKEINVLGSGTISIHDSVLEVNSNKLTFGSSNPVSMSMYGDMFRVVDNGGSIDLRVACERDFVLRMGSDMPLVIDGPSGGLIKIGSGVYIGTALTGESLEIKGPVYLKAEDGVRGLTLGTNGIGIIKISWTEADKIEFIDVTTGKKATLTLS